jgi:ketosteroid isomerase-like protein
MEGGGSGRDTAQAMSEENVEAFKRGNAAWNRGDIDAMLEVDDPEVEVHAVAPAMLGGESTVYRGHEGVRELFRDVHEAFVEHRIEISEIRDLGERVLAVGQLRMRGTGSGAEVESPIAYVDEFKNGKIIRIDDFFDPKEALEAAGLSE